MSVVAERSLETAVERPRSGQAALSLPDRCLLVLTGLLLVALYAPTVSWLIDRWTMSVWHNAHGMLIPFAVAYFARQEIRPLSHLPRHANPWGFAFLVAALVMHVLDTAMHTQILSAASIVVLLPGLSLLFLGTARTRAIAFPLIFMAFMLPLPLVLTERIHLLLREFATAGTSYLVPLLGITVFSEATTLHLREGTLVVGDACSGFSTLYASCAVALLTAYSCNHWRGRVLALTAAVPLAIAANIVRVVLLVLAVRFLGMESLDTWIHPGSGMLTFVLAIPAILWLGRPSASPKPQAI